MSRLDENKKILKIISDYIESNPDQRFHQALLNLGIITESNQYNDESSRTLERTTNALIQIKKTHEPILRQYSFKDGSYFSKPSEVIRVLKKIFNATSKKNERENNDK